ncbi:TLDc [Nesidiocoris tenuis]|uniref:MTOR-associated protein MEAK7 n=1 Tax=Nesidiocoris tenuis TaxID=355587 RepID=A0ABN7AJV7_9HEMI|nr:TLDc [Nesidiocoris tenuis]
MGAENSKRKASPKTAFKKRVCSFLNLASPTKDISAQTIERAWKDKLDSELFAKLQRVIFKSHTAISFESFADFYYKLVEGTVDDKASVVFSIVNPKNEDCADLSALQSYVANVLNTLVNLHRGSKEFSKWNDIGRPPAFYSCDNLALYITKDMPESFALEKLENWYNGNAIFKRVSDYVYQSAFSVYEDHRTFIPLPVQDALVNIKGTTILTLGDILFLNSALLAENTVKWRLLYSSSVHGQSWQTLCKCILGQGPTLIVIEDEHNAVIGAFGSASWRLSPSFYGNDSSFLFALRPQLSLMTPTGFNSNFQYINSGAATLPNGMGFGGKLEYFGLFLSSDFGKGKVSNSCTTYNNFKLPNDPKDFDIKHMEVWGVGKPDPTPEELGERRTCLDQDPTASALLEMAGKTMHSKDLRQAKPEDEYLENCSR